MPDFFWEERVVVVIPEDYNGSMEVRLESTMVQRNDGSTSLSPFPPKAIDLLQRYNSSTILVQMGSSASSSFPMSHQPLDIFPPQHLDMWFRPDIGPSGVSVGATLKKSDQNDQRKQFRSLLEELVEERLLLAPLQSIHSQRLHRYVTQFSDKSRTLPGQESSTTRFETILPMEGSPLAAEAMREFQKAFSPCHSGDAGIFHSIDATSMSDALLHRSSSSRHSWWISLQHDTKDVLKTTLTKGIQYSIPFPPKSKGMHVLSLSNLFPGFQRTKTCPFVDKTTVAALVRNDSVFDIQMEQDPVLQRHISDSKYDVILHALEINSLENPWMTLSTTSSALSSEDDSLAPYWSVHQTVQRPLGISYAGTFVIEISSLRTLPDTCTRTTSVDLNWLLPSIVEPTWQSLRVQTKTMVQDDQQKKSWGLSSSLLWSELSGKINQREDGSFTFHIPSFDLSAETQLIVSLDYEPSFLPFERFPADANRGIELPPAVADFTIPPCNTSTMVGKPTLPPKIRLFSNSVLIQPPIPDMSMPFNVISIVCSLYAFIIGSILNMLIRRASEKVKGKFDPSSVPLSTKQKMKQKIQALFGSVKKLLLKRSKESENTTSSEDFQAEECNVKTSLTKTTHVDHDGDQSRNDQVMTSST